MKVLNFVFILMAVGRIYMLDPEVSCAVLYDCTCSDTSEDYSVVLVSEDSHGEES